MNSDWKSIVYWELEGKVESLKRKTRSIRSDKNLFQGEDYLLKTVGLAQTISTLKTAQNALLAYETMEEYQTPLNTLKEKFEEFSDFPDERHYSEFPYLFSKATFEGVQNAIVIIDNAIELAKSSEDEAL